MKVYKLLCNDEDSRFWKARSLMGGPEHKQSFTNCTDRFLIALSHAVILYWSNVQYLIFEPQKITRGNKIRTCFVPELSPMVDPVWPWTATLVPGTEAGSLEARRPSMECSTSEAAEKTLMNGLGLEIQVCSHAWPEMLLLFFQGSVFSRSRLQRTIKC